MKIIVERQQYENFVVAVHINLTLTTQLEAQADGTIIGNSLDF